MNKPKYKIQEIVRYSGGPTALMRITSIRPGDWQGNTRYYGVQFYGDSMGAHESDLQPATPEEIKKFETDDHIGRLRDYGDRLNPPESVEYGLIRKFYGNRCAERSKVPLINHINEGLDILESLGACEDTRKAYCLHPLVQNDKDLMENYESLSKCSPLALIFALEYRSVANEYLSQREIKDLNEIRLSPLYQVNNMLIADKLQNYKDFLIHHLRVHPRWRELDAYFRNWLIRLKIPTDKWPKGE